MRIRVLFVTAGLLTGALVSSVNGCGSSDNNNNAIRLSQKGEACQVSGDCAAGLACIPLPASGVGSSYVGICVTGEFHISVTAKECAITECSTAEDCCPTPPANCTFLAQQCALAGDAGATNSYCIQYAALCQCDTTKRECDPNQRCQVRCVSDLECSGASTGSKCAGGHCVQCAVDTDCNSGGTTDRMCINGSCQSPCQTDGDCAGFARCTAGKCFDSGCQTDRECVAATRNVEATCGTDGKCIVPCQTDLECGNPKSYSFFSCISHQCTYTGCQNDKDCRLLLTGASDASTLGSKQHVVCRDKVLPTNTTTPAK
jgi:hypothetical protein